MKAILMVAVGCLVYLSLITLIFRLWEVRARVAFMTRFFLATVPVFLVAYLLTPPDLGFLPPDWVDHPAWLGRLFALFLYGAAFFGGMLQLYNLSERGFSLRMLIEIDESPRGTMTVAEMMRGYSRGKGIQWMYWKRLNDLLDHGLVTISDGTLRNTARGRRTARLFGWLQDFIGLRQKD
jgi:hypothetical protein